MNKKDIVVVVPIYLPVLSTTEKLSLEQCLKVLADYSIVIIKPQNLDIAGIASQYVLPHVVCFPDECFSSLRAYNKLVLDEKFYRSFVDYTYMLIYQLDAYVFKDELFFWANQGYDYIGAPWIPWKNAYLKRTSVFYLYVQRYFWSLVNRQKLYQERFYWYQVGNGGFSLRKINKMIKITSYYKKEITSLLLDEKPFLPEDIFLLWNLKARRYRLKKPPFGVAMKFAMEHNPFEAYKENNCQLPFGCHNWSHQEMLPFWSQFIKY